MDGRLVGISLRTALSSMADLAMPRVCAVCGRELLTRERCICTCCLADMPLTRYETLSHNPMADRFNARIASDAEPREGVPEQSSSTERYVLATALFFYRPLSGYPRLTQALKYRRDFRTGRLLAHMLGQRIAASSLYADIDLIVPVPLHRTRRIERGYNQAEIIARKIADATGAELAADLLQRVRKTASQTRLDAEGKAANVRGAFRLNSKREGLLTGSDGKKPIHILLVDDVFTTGATIYSCYRALRPHTDAKISIATLACVEQSI